MRTTHTQATAIRAAFENIKVVMPKGGITKDNKDAVSKLAIIGQQVWAGLAGKAGISNELDWNAKLSMKTAASLDAPNFNPVKMVDDGHGGKSSVSVFNQRAWSTGTYNKMCA